MQRVQHRHALIFGLLGDPNGLPYQSALARRCSLGRCLLHSSVTNEFKHAPKGVRKVILVEVRGYKLNYVLKDYLTSELRVRRVPPLAVRREHRLTRRLGGKTVEKLVAEYAAGTPAVALAERYGLAKSTVLRHVREAGAPVRYSRFSDAERVQTVELHKQRLAQTAIAAQLGRSSSAAWRVLRRAGLVG